MQPCPCVGSRVSSRNNGSQAGLSQSERFSQPWTMPVRAQCFDGAGGVGREERVSACGSNKKRDALFGVTSIKDMQGLFFGGGRGGKYKFHRTGSRRKGVLSGCRHPSILINVIITNTNKKKSQLHEPRADLCLRSL